MIMNTWYEEEVNGYIVGKCVVTGTLRYEGRQQGNPLFSESDDQLLSDANALLADIKRQCGRAFELIYPKDAWELRIH